MKVFKFEEGETVHAAGGIVKWVIWPKTGATGVNLHYVILPPGHTAPLHAHENSESVTCILQGKGKVMSDKEEYDVEAEMAVYVGKKEPHGVTNTGDMPMIMLAIQAPPDLDQYKRAGKMK